MRFERSLIVGLVAGVVAAALAVALVAFVRSPTTTYSPLTVVLCGFGLGVFVGFALALMWPDYAPPQPKDDGDAEAGVPARLIPPTPVLRGKAFPFGEKRLKGHKLTFDNLSRGAPERPRAVGR